MSRHFLLALFSFWRVFLSNFQLVHKEGRRHPINKLLAFFPVRFVVLALLLAALVVLNRYDVTNLMAWTDPVFPKSHYPWLFGGFLVLFACNHFASGKWRKAVLLAFSLAAMAYFSLWFAAGSLAFFGAYYLVVFSRMHRHLKLGFLCCAYIGLGVLSNLLLFPQFLMGNPWILILAYAFGVNYTFRIFYFYHEAKMRKFKRVPFVDFLLYFVFAPYFIIMPYMFAIIRYGAFAKSLNKHNESLESSGIRHILAGVIIIIIYHFAASVYAPGDELTVCLRNEQFVKAFFVGILYYPVAVVFSALRIGYVLVGLMQVLGIDILPAFRNPLMSTSIHDWWRRWNIHFREFLVDIFFYPLMIKWRRKNPYLTIVVGCMSVFVVGSTLFHWIAKYYFRMNSHENVYWSIMVENGLMCIFVAIGLCVEKHRLLNMAKRQPGKPPRLDNPEAPVWTWFAFKVRKAAMRGFTWAMLLVVVVFAGYGSTYAVYVRPLETAEKHFEEAAKLAETGALEAAADNVVGDLPTLESHVRMRPRDSALRFKLAYIYALPSPAHDPDKARLNLEMGIAFQEPGNAGQAALLAHLRKLLD